MRPKIVPEFSIVFKEKELLATLVIQTLLKVHRLQMSLRKPMLGTNAKGWGAW